MKFVDIIRPGSINSIIGPVGTLKRILKNEDYFHSRGYDVTVFSQESIQVGPFKTPPTPLTSSQKTGVVSSFRRKVSSFLRMKAKTNRILAEWFINRSRKECEELVDYYLSLNRNPDVVEFHSDWECYYYLKKRRDKNAKTVMFLHSDGIPFKMELQYYPVLQGSSFIAKLKDELDFTVKNVDRIVFIARVGQKNFLERYPERTKEDTSVIINGIDDLTDAQKDEVSVIKAKAETSEFTYRLCCSGTINTRKGHRIIIEALHKLPKDILIKTHVDFMGDGGERPVLESLVAKYGLENNVTFYGAVPNTEIYKYLAKNNIYILMSKNEGLPISIIEAMRAGLPIISTNVSGIPELIKTGHNGFLIEPSEDELVSLLEDLPKYDWGTMGENSLKRFENEFTFTRMENEFCDMFDSL